VTENHGVGGSIPPLGTTKSRAWLGTLREREIGEKVSRETFVHRSPYGYASNAQGIRHALLDADEATVDEADALFMIGACATFVSYLSSTRRETLAFIGNGS
jgi:hypothetical protein